MVAYSEQRHQFPCPLPYIALAHNQRFPSPFSGHVESSDVISRRWSSSRPSVLKTTRLVLKRGKMPAWAPGRVANVGTSWVLEESECDMEADESKELRVRSRNIDYTTVMEVFEWQTFREDDKEPDSTVSKTLTRVTSEFGFWPLRSRIEKFGISRGSKSTEKARQGLALVATHLFDPSTSSTLLSSGPLSPYAFPSTPLTLSELVRTRFEEARAVVLRRQKAQDEADEKRWVESEEPGRIWRERWRRAARRGNERFRERVCELTGLLCATKEKKEV